MRAAWFQKGTCASWRFSKIRTSGVMPSDETRRVLKLFGVAVTSYEDCVDKGAPVEEINKAEAEIGASLSEVTALIERLRGKKNNPSQQKSESKD
jgi:hypothetical protein